MKWWHDRSCFPLFFANCRSVARSGMVCSWARLRMSSPNPKTPILLTFKTKMSSKTQFTVSMTKFLEISYWQKFEFEGLCYRFVKDNQRPRKTSDSGTTECGVWRLHRSATNQSPGSCIDKSRIQSYGTTLQLGYSHWAVYQSQTGEKFGSNVQVRHFYQRRSTFYWRRELVNFWSYFDLVFRLPKFENFQTSKFIFWKFQMLA